MIGSCPAPSARRRSSAAVTGRSVWFPPALRANRSGTLAGENVCGRERRVPRVLGTAAFKFFEPTWSPLLVALTAPNREYIFLISIYRDIAMTTVAKPDRLLFRFRPADSGNGVSRATLARLAETLGFTETQVMHYALKRLAAEVLPAYEPDDGELTPEQLDAIRQAEPQGRVRSVSSSLF